MIHGLERSVGDRLVPIARQVVQPVQLDGANARVILPVPLAQEEHDLLLDAIENELAERDQRDFAVAIGEKLA